MAEMKDTPEYRSDEYEALHKKWAFVDILLGGTMAMREAKTAMLVKFPGEEDDEYRYRLEQATFDNDYADALDAFVGALVRKPPVFEKDVPPNVRADLEDVDLAGTHINVFTQRITRKGGHQGAAYVLVEKPPLPETNGEPLRANEAERLGLRPYCVLYGAADLQDEPPYVTINGREVLHQIVFRECADVPDGNFKRKEVERYRVYRLPVEQLPNRTWRRARRDDGKAAPVEWELWEETENEKREKEVTQVDSGTLDGSITEIPVAVFNANPDPDDVRQTAGPVFYELGEKARLIYNQQSDYHRSIHMTASPVPVIMDADLEAMGKTPDGGISPSPTRAVVLKNGGSFAYSEPAGTGLAAYVTCIENGKAMIRQMSFEALYAEATVQTTATEQLLRAGKRATRLAMAEQSLHDCLETMLKYMAWWRGIPGDSGGSVTMAGTSDAVILSDSQLATMLQEVTQGAQSRETYWQMKQKAGLLPDDFDAVKEAERLDAEAEKAANRAARAFNAGDVGDGSEDESALES